MRNWGLCGRSVCTGLLFVSWSSACGEPQVPQGEEPTAAASPAAIESSPPPETTTTAAASSSANTPPADAGPKLPASTFVAARAPAGTAIDTWSLSNGEVLVGVGT